MALKVKGKAAKQYPKSGPKKRRAKSEEAAIREAIEEHGKRGVRATRKSSKVNAFKYKETETAKRKRADAYVAEQERIHGLREPKSPTEFELFLAGLPEDQQPFGDLYWYMQCEHKNEKPHTVDPSFTNGVTPVWMSCPDCGLVRRWNGNRTDTKLAEWTAYCPDGYDMFDWLDLFVRDRAMWRFIHDEVIAEMTDNALTEEAT